MNNSVEFAFIVIVCMTVSFLSGMLLHQCLGPTAELWYGIGEIKPSDVCIVMYKWEGEWKVADIKLPPGDAYRFIKKVKKVEK